MHVFNPFAKREKLKLYWWRHSESKHGNFGDEITKLIIERNFKIKVEWAPPSECQMIATGSILDILVREREANKPIVWGSGFIEEGETKLSYNDSSILSVRGKFSLARISDVPADKHITLGDPGLLADSLLVKRSTKQYRLGIIPHYIDKDHPAIQRIQAMPGVHVIDPTDNCLEVIKTIDSCDTIISSSLHGLIVSDSLGVPNAHIKLSENLKGGDYKFMDYYSVFKDPRYFKIPLEMLTSKNSESLADYIAQQYVWPSDIKDIKSTIKQSFRT